MNWIQSAWCRQAMADEKPTTGSFQLLPVSHELLALPAARVSTSIMHTDPNDAHARLWYCSVKTMVAPSQ